MAGERDKPEEEPDVPEIPPDEPQPVPVQDPPAEPTTAPYIVERGDAVNTFDSGEGRE